MYAECLVPLRWLTKSTMGYVLSWPLFIQQIPLRVWAALGYKDEQKHRAKPSFVERAIQRGGEKLETNAKSQW